MLPQTISIDGKPHALVSLRSDEGDQQILVSIPAAEKVDSSPKSTRNRAVVVVDRGWIFAGDVTRVDGRILLSRAVHVFKWKDIGFAKMVETADADLRPIADVDIPGGAEIFSVPVEDDWGLK